MTIIVMFSPPHVFLRVLQTEKIQRKTVCNVVVQYKPGGEVEKGAKGGKPKTPGEEEESSPIGKLLVTCPATPGVVWVYYLQGQK